MLNAQRKTLLQMLLQKWLPSTNSICSSVLRCAFSSAVALSTSSPGAARTVQAAPMRPSTLTVQMRQEPCGANSGCQHRCGM